MRNKFWKKQTNSFAARVYTAVSRIKAGKVVTYAEVARRAGSRDAGRAVGTLMAKNRYYNVPCHRVIRSDFSIGNYSGEGGRNGKIKKLLSEGVNIKGGKVVFNNG